MTLKLRKLRGDDLFTLLSIIGKLDLRSEVVGWLNRRAEARRTAKYAPQDHKAKKPTKAEAENEVAAAGESSMVILADIAFKAVANIELIRDDVNGLLAGLAGTNIETIRELPLGEYISLIMQIFKDPGLTDFFTSLGLADGVKEKGSTD